MSPKVELVGSEPQLVLLAVLCASVFFEQADLAVGGRFRFQVLLREPLRPHDHSQPITLGREPGAASLQLHQLRRDDAEFGADLSGCPDE